MSDYSPYPNTEYSTSMSGKPTVPISEVNDLGVLPSATATWDQAGDGLSESTVTVMGGLEHSVRLEEEGFCEERPQSRYSFAVCVRNNR
jgi:hypothetical protein